MTTTTETIFAGWKARADELADSLDRFMNEWSDEVDRVLERHVGPDEDVPVWMADQIADCLEQVRAAAGRFYV